MDLNPVILAIPVFFGLMGLELAFEFITRKHTYRLNDAVTNISTGTLQQLSGVFLQILTIGIYTVVFEKWSILTLPVNGWTFAAVFVLYDLGYYWAHRMAHEVSLFWGGHVVHHQSEDYNLSVALRQSSTAVLWAFPFYLPLAIMGFAPNQMVLAAGLNLLYQFWIHTEHIHKLPRWAEAVLNTPSHHRVHHGRDPKYIDKNYAGVFIVWDRMFGTFTEEEERPHYGITTPLQSWNPVYANFAHYLDLGKLIGQSRSVSDAVKILMNKPGWRPEYLGGYMKPEEVPADYHKFNTDAPFRGAKLYTFMQFLAASGGYSLFFFTQAGFSLEVKLLYGSWMILSTLMFGFLFEWRKAWVTGLEWIRLLAIPAGLLGLQSIGLNLPNALVWAAGFFALASIGWLTQILKMGGSVSVMTEKAS
ncbi:MAG: sterol desaturase family protein [Bacteroidia bacterium]|nr:sterol desaturase family protein [Bacteroidia bacterium]